MANIKIFNSEPGVFEYKPCSTLSLRDKTQRIKSIFLAGTIDMGNSINWQKEFVNKLSEPVTLFKDTQSYRRYNVFNPRRDDWDASWTQTLDNPQFYQQVNWEYDALCKADIIVMNLLEDSKSAISLLELGLFADTSKILMICPPKFYRKGNVDFVCEKYDIPQFEDVDTLIKYLDNR